MIVNFGGFFEDELFFELLFPPNTLCINVGKNALAYILGDFLRTRLVTLDGSRASLSSFFVFYSFTFCYFIILSNFNMSKGKMSNPSCQHQNVDIKCECALLLWLSRPTGAPNP
jgi:hypothetical protein